MSDSFTEVTTTSWFSRIKNSLSGILVGIVLFFGAFPVIFLNEGNAVKVADSLDEGAGVVVSVKSLRPDSSNNGKLIHLTGEVKTSETLSDADFGVNETAIKLIRKVEMYQWTEKKESKTETKLGGKEETTTTYDYVKKWSEGVVDSSGFKRQGGHENPSGTDYTKQEFVISKATLGEFDLTPDLIGKISGSESLPLEKIPYEIRTKYGSRVTIQNGSLYIGKNPASPEVGDQRISFEVVRPGTVSIIAKQDGKTLRPYRTSNGKSIEMLSSGDISADEMFEQAQSANTMMTWLFRLIGFMMMFTGLKMVFKVLSVIGSVVPFIGDLIGMGTGIVSFLIALATFLIVVAVSWIAARPILGITLIVLAVGTVVALFVMKKKKGGKSKKAMA